MGPSALPSLESATGTTRYRKKSIMKRLLYHYKLLYNITYPFSSPDINNVKLHNYTRLRII